MQSCYSWQFLTIFSLYYQWRSSQIHDIRKLEKSRVFYISSTLKVLNVWKRSSNFHIIDIIARASFLCRHTFSSISYITLYFMFDTETHPVLAFRKYDWHWVWSIAYNIFLLTIITPPVAALTPKSLLFIYSILLMDM